MKGGGAALCATAALFVPRTRNNKHYTSHTAYQSYYSYYSMDTWIQCAKNMLTDICNDVRQQDWRLFKLVTLRLDTFPKFPKSPIDSSLLPLCSTKGSIHWHGTVSGLSQHIKSKHSTMIQWKNFERETATDKVNMMKLNDKLNRGATYCTTHGINPNLSYILV